MAFKAATQRYTSDNLTIIILCNRTDLDPNALAVKTAQLLLTNSQD